MLQIGDTIEYLADVGSPPSQKGIRGQVKVIDRDIPMWTAKFLLRGGKIRLYDPASPLQLEEEETKEDPAGPESVISTKAEKERRTKTNGQSTSKRNQKGDHGPKKPDPQRRGGSRRD